MVPAALQFWQAWPFSPQAVWSEPDRQRSPTQQPLQLVASHFLVVLHVRSLASQDCPVDAQFAQTPPPVPHAAASVPVRQVCEVPFTTQQPEGQLAASQVGTFLPHAFRLESQVSKPPATQSVHAFP